MFNIGIGVVIFKQNRILVGVRGPACSRGSGCWALAGGKLDPGESIRDAIVREVAEETGLEISVPENPIFLITDHSPEPCVSLWAVVNWESGVPQTKEPDKCLYWEWKTTKELSQLPNVFDPKSEEYYWLPMDLLLAHCSNRPVDSGCAVTTI